MNSEAIERVIADGDLSQLTSEQRVSYYRATCESVGLNPITQPFEYLRLNGKLVLYAKRAATEQLRTLRNVSLELVSAVMLPGDAYVVTAKATMPGGRFDTSTGAVAIKGLTGDALANALMKAETKAKRRVTLSICGLAYMDESELDTVRGAERLPPEPATPQLSSGTSGAEASAPSGRPLLQQPAPTSLTAGVSPDGPALTSEGGQGRLVTRPSSTNAEPASAPKEPALVNGGSESALWSTYAAEISQAMSLGNLAVLAKGIKANAKQGKLTPTQVGHLSEMGKARRAALEAEPRTVAAALEGNQLPVSWGGPPPEEDLCVTCKAPLGASAAVSTTDADGVVGFRHQACGAPV